MARQRAELSKNNKYYIPRERYLELVHFCAQHDEWLKEKRRLEDEVIRPIIFDEPKGPNHDSNKVEQDALKLAELDDKIKLIEQTAIKHCDDLSLYIILAVTRGMSYDSLVGRFDMPCSKNMFYNRYRKFFYELDKVRR